MSINIPQASVFDLDGLLIDSEKIHSQAFMTIVQRYAPNAVCDSSVPIHIVGISEEANWIRLKKKYAIEKDVSELIKERQSLYPRLLAKNVHEMPGAKSILRLLRSKGMKLGIASSSTLLNIKLVLQKLNLLEFFNVIVSGECVRGGKSSPDIFLEACRQLDTEPHMCVAFEDTEGGIKAAKKAGMKTVAVPNAFTANHDFSKADLIVSSLDEITWNMLCSL